MQFLTLEGKQKNIPIEKYRIDWNGKSPSKLQESVKVFFSQYWEKHFCYEEMPCAGTRMRLDFFNLTKRLAVEVQGEQHVKYNPHWHKKKTSFYDQTFRDLLKENWCEKNNIRLIKIYYDDLPLTEPWILKQFGKII